MAQRLELSKGWRMQLEGEQEAIDVPSLPATSLPTLVQAGKVPDPFLGRNEALTEVQEVGEKAVRFDLTFSSKLAQGESAALVFDGLDTFCTVSLNGSEILKTRNMFVPARIDVSDKLKSGDNKLALEFEPSVIRGRMLEEEFGTRETMLGHSSRVYIRMQQSKYGWDWGPILHTSGPWRPIYLETYQARILEPFANPTLAADLSSADIAFTAGLAGSADLYATITAPGGKTLVPKTKLANGKGQAKASLTDDLLWWPVGSGEPVLCKCTWTAEADGKVLDTVEQNVGFRRIEVIQEVVKDEDGKDEEGRSFYFKINNKPTWCSGSDWINGDSFVDRMDASVYERWVKLARDGNQNMIRVWGGGVYEHDAFYDACDRHGILVWQDFMFACASYPTHDEFLSNVHEEVVAQGKRLRVHPCMALWAGNNENQMLAQWLKWSGYTKDDPILYHHVIPKALKEAFAEAFYWPSSPWGPSDGDANSRTHGDCHMWDVWHGPLRPYQDYGKLSSRFCSEFGMMGACDIRTTRQYAQGSHPQDSLVTSQLFEQHNKCDDQARRLGIYLAENIPYATDVDNYTYATQVIQSEAVTEAFRQWRRKWFTDNRRSVGGALVWQLNDCWPTNSWAIVDYYARPKPAYYALKRESQTVTGGIEVIFPWGELSAPRPHSALVSGSACFQIYGSNLTTKPRKVKLDVAAWDTFADAPYEPFKLKDASAVSTLEPNGSTVVAEVVLPPLGMYGPAHPKLVVKAHIKDAESGEILARIVNWAQPLKFHHLLDPKLDIKVSGDKATITCQRPAKCVWLDVTEDEELLPWSDNGFDLYPGDELTVSAAGLKGRVPTVRWLGDHIKV